MLAAFLGLVVGCGDDGNAAGGDGGSGTNVDAGAGADANPGEPQCVFAPTGQFNPAIECSWNGPPMAAAYPQHDDVVMTPVVINLTDDNGDGAVDLDDIPDIAFVAYPLQTGAACPAGATCGCCNSSGVLRVVSGSCTDGTLSEHYVVGPTEIEAALGVAGVWLDNSGGLAVGDINGDGAAEIVATALGGGTIAFKNDGTPLWYQPMYPTGADHLAATQPALADVDGDGTAEIVQGRVVLNGEDGSLQWQGTAGLGTNGFLGPVSVVGDVDLSGTSNVLAGGSIYESDGTEAASVVFPTPITAANCLSQGKPCDGFTATGNFDEDDEGEVVITRAGTIHIVNHDGSPMERDGAPVRIAIPVDDCVYNEGGPPTVADFDGDGEPEIGVAGADFYVVADLECLVTPLPAQCSDPGIRWKTANNDCSSRVTGSSVFDFDGDGKAEVVYADEVRFQILDGVTGEIRREIPNRSHTRLEMPIVVDVDNDGNAEIVFVENAHGGGMTAGIRVWGDETDSWVATRRIWNQHSYHVTNVGELGEIPRSEPVNWLTATDATVSKVMNNFRQNLPEAEAFAAPDLTVTLAVEAAICGLSATVCNVGDIVAGAGVRVTFWDNATEAELVCEAGPVSTSAPLPPGACETVSCALEPPPAGPIDVRACVDNADYACTSQNAGGNNECDENNNRAEVTAEEACVPVE